MKMISDRFFKWWAAAAVIFSILFVSQARAQTGAIDAPNGLADYTARITLPTENVDGSPIDDLTSLLIYDCQSTPSCTPDQNEQIIPVVGQEGQTVDNQHAVTLVGNANDLVTVGYAAKVRDASGNTSAVSNSVRVVWRIVDTGVPNPPVFLDVPLTVLGCETPEGVGYSCGGEVVSVTVSEPSNNPIGG
jgi:hypothetical protein